MKIENKTRKNIIAENAGHAKSFFSRMQGLMLCRKPKTLVIEASKSGIEPCSIHMFFMLFPIDVIWVDELGVVVDTYESAKPFSLRIFSPELAAKYVIEAPVGTIKSSKTKKGDNISLN
jgi:uncharacterized protein